MPRDSSATKARILEAAFREFAAHGLAGARVDRIATAAGANKRAIYDYFGDKERLFDATVVDVVTRGAREVPASWDDLPRYAGDIYDYFWADPDRMRIHLWRQLERPEPFDGEVQAYGDMVKAMTAADPSRSGPDAARLFALVWALHFTWFLALPALPHVERPGPHSRHRAAQRKAVVDAVRLLAAGADGRGGGAPPAAR